LDDTLRADTHRHRPRIVSVVVSSLR
jgi:hypothetical protein